MLQESNCFQKIYIACGKTDLRKGIDGLAELVKHQFQLEPYQKNVLFLFCGTRSDRIKGLVWEGDGYLLLYKRIADGRFRWPRNSTEAAQITQEQYDDVTYTIKCDIDDWQSECAEFNDMHFDY